MPAPHTRVNIESQATSIKVHYLENALHQYAHTNMKVLRCKPSVQYAVKEDEYTLTPKQ